LRALLYTVLKETAHDREPYKNPNENRRLPRWSDKRAARWARSKVRICRYRIWNWTIGGQLRCRVALMVRQFPEKEW
jgi:hypothetical protein